MYTEISKGHNSVNSVGGVMVLVLSILSDGVFVSSLSKYLIGLQSYELGAARSMLGWSQMLKDRRTERQKTRSLYRPMPEAGVTKIATVTLDLQC